MSETWWWWQPPRDGGVVPDYPPLDVTGRAATRGDLTCGRWCVNTPAGPCDEVCVMEWIAANEGAPDER